MKVIIAALTRFHLFNMAIGLNNKSNLDKLITSYPKHKLKYQWSRLKNKSVNLIIFAVFWKVLLFLDKTKLPFFIVSNFRFFIYKSFSKSVSKKINGNEDFVIGLSGFMLDTINNLSSSKIKTIVDHGSLHENTTKEILLEECKKFGFEKFGNWKHNWMLNRMEYEFKSADYIFVCSQLAKKTMIDNNINENKIFVNPLGIDLNSFGYYERKRSRTFRFLHISNMSPLKGLHYIIDAFNNLSTSYENIELWLVGPAPKEIKLLEMIDSNDKIIYFPPVKEEKLVEYYHKCDLFIHPSLSDGWGMTVMQAMATGLPVVVSNMTGVKEIINNGNNGWIVESKNSLELLNIMQHVIKNHDQLLEIGKNGYRTVKNGYTWDDYSNRLINWLENHGK